MFLFVKCATVNKVYLILSYPILVTQYLYTELAPWPLTLPLSRSPIPVLTNSLTSSLIDSLTGSLAHSITNPPTPQPPPDSPPTPNPQPPPQPPTTPTHPRLSLALADSLTRPLSFGISFADGAIDCFTVLLARHLVDVLSYVISEAIRDMKQTRRGCRSTTRSS